VTETLVTSSSARDLFTFLYRKYQTRCKRGQITPREEAKSETRFPRGVKFRVHQPFRITYAALQSLSPQPHLHTSRRSRCQLLGASRSTVLSNDDVSHWWSTTET